MKRWLFAISFFLLILGLTIFSYPVFAVDDEDEQYPTIETVKEAQEDAVQYIIPTVLKKKYGRLELDVAASLVAGYDANVNLDRYDRDGSIFTQKTLGLYGKYELIDSKVFVRTGYDFTWIKYWKFSDPDLLDNILSTGVDMKVTDNLMWSVDYMADFVGFPRDEQSEYTMNLIETSLRHDINDWIYQKVIYQFLHKHYPKWKPNNAWGIRQERDRSDSRNSITHQLGVFVGNKTFFKTENKFSMNDSNELFLDFYDYHAFKTKVSVTHILTNKIYGTASFAYQYKAYEQRSVGAQDFDQRDNLYIYNTSLFYDIIPAVSLGMSFDYRENNSNENQQKYEDYIISSGIYAVF